MRGTRCLIFRDSWEEFVLNFKVRVQKAQHETYTILKVRRRESIIMSQRYHAADKTLRLMPLDSQRSQPFNNRTQGFKVAKEAGTSWNTRNWLKSLMELVLQKRPQVRMYEKNSQHH